MKNVTSIWTRKILSLVYPISVYSFYIDFINYSLGITFARSRVFFFALIRSDWHLSSQQNENNNNNA